jgi:DNA-binding MarR family transcriptional regulator
LVTTTKTPRITRVLDAWVRILRAHSISTRNLNADLLAKHGLTINDHEALLHLSHAEGGRMRRVDLAERLLLTASGVTRLLDGLEAGGLVGKASCATDRRVTYAVLTKAGWGRLAEASASHIAAVRELFEERYTDEELEQLTELLSRLPGVGEGDGSDCEAGESPAPASS